MLEQISKVITLCYIWAPSIFTLILILILTMNVLDWCSKFLLKHNSYLSLNSDNFVTRGVRYRPSRSSLCSYFSWLVAKASISLFHGYFTLHPPRPPLYMYPPNTSLLDFPICHAHQWPFWSLCSQCWNKQPHRTSQPFPITICKQPWHTCTHPYYPFPNTGTLSK